MFEQRWSRRPSAAPPLVSVSQESGSSADHSGETVLEVDFRPSRSPGTRKVSMTEPTRRLSVSMNPTLSRDRSPSPFQMGRRGSRSPYNRSRDWESEENGKRRSSSTVGQQQPQHRSSTRKREQWARSVRAKTLSARSSLFSTDSEAYPVHPLLRSTRSTSPRPSISGSSSRSSSTSCLSNCSSLKT